MDSVDFKGGIPHAHTEQGRVWQRYENFVSYSPRAHGVRQDVDKCLDSK
jgi:hypothetical protein